MRRVVIESPLAGDNTDDGSSAVEANRVYARACMRDSLQRGEAPFASHLLYDQPGIFDDLIPAERERGIAAGFAWGEAAELTAVYIDRGISAGMRQGIVAARAAGRFIVHRSLSCPGVDLPSAVLPSVFTPYMNDWSFATEKNEKNVSDR